MHVRCIEDPSGTDWELAPTWTWTDNLINTCMGLNIVRIELSVCACHGITVTLHELQVPVETSARHNIANGV